MQNKLLECPFCGGEAKVSKNGAGCYQVYCCNCESRQYAYAHKTEEEAIEQWNTRKPMERIVEQLEESMNEAKNLWDDDEYYTGQANAYEYAIEIVKGGADNAE